MNPDGASAIHDMVDHARAVRFISIPDFGCEEQFFRHAHPRFIGGLNPGPGPNLTIFGDYDERSGKF